ncbi:DUF6875 domain-containing protein [Pseudomonas synxantha]|uniref:DUF6875 domain-containing protein n=1 Tax=Pseudomonas synxantha TaxID=47883 RepID=UPI00061495A1|nr:hypothetical protein [Pseudomonas synxantha]
MMKIEPQHTDHSTPLELIPIANLINSAHEDDSTLSPLQHIARWSSEYLCKPSADIGRPGVVCPWTPNAMKRETFWLTELATRDRCDQAVCEDMLSLIGHFNRAAPTEGDKTQFKTIVAVFPDIHPEHKVDEFHAMLKPAFLDAGLMLGEFYSTCKKPGLRNPEFRPLTSPIPLLVVREMVDFDIVFLADSQAYVNAYLKRHGAAGLDTLERTLKHRERFGLDPDQVVILERTLAEHRTTDSRVS